MRYVSRKEFSVKSLRRSEGVTVMGGVGDFWSESGEVRSSAGVTGEVLV